LELSRKESGCYPTLGTIRTSFSDLLYASPMAQEIIMSIRKGFHKILQYRMQLTVTIVRR
jgi:hypothetical protein